MTAEVKPWTEAEIARAVQLRKSGLLIKEVAEQLGRTFDSTASKIGNLKTLIDGKAKAPAARPRLYRSRSEFVTASLMGDPPPGRSALDQRQA